MAASLKASQARVTGVLLRCLACEKKYRLLSKCAASLNRISALSTEPNATAPLKGDKQKIVIPDKIVRSHTALLEALASTVKSNANQPMYMGIDDPHLLGTSDRLKKNYMAAMESGREAAQTLITLTPEHFTPIWEEPLPEAWRDPYLGYKHSEPCEAALLERIEMRKVNDAIDVYKTCKLQKEALSQETLEKLLELLAVFNCEQPVEQSDIEEYISPTFMPFSPVPINSWKKGNVAEDVFHALPEKTASAYCNLICGMATNFEKESAFNLYNEAKSLNLPIDVLTYNKLLATAVIDATSLEDIAHPVESLLRDMVSSQVQPNVDTFNSILSSCKRISKWTSIKKYALSVIAEMKACGMEPELSTYYEILSIFYYVKDKTAKTQDLFEAILDHMTDKDFKVRSTSDVYFFRLALRVISTFFPEPALALKLHGILQRGQNSKALGNRQNVFTYYKDLMMILASLEHTDVLMEVYKSAVPYVFFPTSVVYLAIFENINMHETYGHLPWMFSDLFWSSQFKDAKLMQQFVSSMATKKHDPQLQQQFSDVTTSLLEDWKKNKEKPMDQFHLDGGVIGEMIKIYLNNGESEKAMDVLQMYREESSLQKTNPSCESLIQLTQHHIEAQDYDVTKDLLELQLSLHCASVPDLVEQTLTTFSISEQERNYLRGLADDASC